ncbi:MAG: hypothetical protein IT580_24380 [Verrucomicrobiales bacterium]|nr:hypothetical protein [Verrucomicrobiales bacterium]
MDHWALRLQSTNAPTSIAYAAGRYFGLGLALYHDSLDASAWEYHEVPAALEAGFPVPLNSVACGQGLWVMVGGFPDVSTSGILLTTRDVADPDWQKAVGWTDSAPLMAVVFENGRFVAVGGSVITGARILTSDDGVKWTDRSPGFRQTVLRDVAYGGGRWVAVGGLNQGGAPTAGIILSSTNAVDWTVHDPGPIPGARNGWYVLNGVAYGRGIFVTTGFGDRFVPFLATSNTGSEWTPQSGDSGGSGWDVAFGDGLLVTSGSMRVASSVTGSPMSWTPHLSVELRGNLVFADHAFLGGFRGEVWQSGDVRPRILPITVSESKSLTLRVAAVRSKPLALEQTVDLVHWTTRTQWVAAESIREISIPISDSEPARLFRVRMP